MPPRTDTEQRDYVFRLLPDYVRNDDDGTLATFLGYATTAAMAPALRLADIADPDTSVTGTAEVANPLAAPRPWLLWLAWLLGLDISAIPDADQRDAVPQAALLRRRGTRASIRRAVQRTLTGSQSCRVYWNLSGTDPYLITVVTLTSQTPNSVTTLAAALSEKPAGLDLDVQDTTGATYAELKSDYLTQDYDDLAGDFTDYDDLADWTP